MPHEKCHWDPVKVQVRLGYVIDMIQSKLFVTEERIASAYHAIVSLIDHLDRSYMVKVRVLASVVGKIISMQSVFGKLVCLRTRALHECIISGASWEAPVVVTEEAVCELQFWKGNVKVLNESGRPLKADLSSEVELYCDASSDGYGGYLCMGNDSEAGDTDSVHKVMEQSTKEYSNTISDGSKAAGDSSYSENGNIVMCQGRSSVYDGSYTICGGNDDMDDVIDDYVICADSKLRNMTEDETIVGHSLMTVCPCHNTGNEMVYRYENQNDNRELEVTGTWSEREKVRSST